MEHAGLTENPTDFNTSSAREHDKATNTIAIKPVSTPTPKPMDTPYFKALHIFLNEATYFKNFLRRCSQRRGPAVVGGP